MAEELFGLHIPNFDMQKELRLLDKTIRFKMARMALRAAASVFRKALRESAKRWKLSGDLVKSIAVKIKKYKRGYFAIVGNIYGKFGEPSNTSQDPGVYARFLHKGTNRADRGSTRATNWADVARSPAVHRAASQAFADKIRDQANKLDGLFGNKK